MTERGIPMPRDEEAARTIQEGFEVLDALTSSTSEINSPVTGGVSTEGLLLQHLLNIDFQDLLHPMCEDYIHFLHRLVLMGIVDPRRSGKYRSVSVHVGNPDLLFAAERFHN